MTLLEAIHKAATEKRPIELSPKDAERVLSALDVAKVRKFLRSGLEEPFEGTIP